MTKKILFSLGVVAVFVIYVIFTVINSSSNSNVTAPQNTFSASDQPSNQAPTSSSVSSSGSTNPPADQTTASMYKDGTYTGSVADNIYGNIQVSATISGGKITDVEFIEYPQAPGHTTQVSAMALPALKSEAIAAQSANVDIVSGATQDSQAFQQSLASALAQAQN